MSSSGTSVIAVGSSCITSSGSAGVSCSTVTVACGTGTSSTTGSGSSIAGAATCGACSCANSGGSNRTVYSLSKRPFGQLTSTKKVKKGSRTGSLEVTLITVRPSDVETGSNFNCVRKYGRGTPTRSNTSAGANSTRISSNSSGRAEIK